MARYIFVAGEANNAMRTMFQPFQDIEITNTFGSVRSLTEDIMANGISFLQLVKSVIVVDYGFTSKTTEGRFNEFIELQDILKSNMLQGTKLYLITKDTDLNTKLRDGYNGMPGIHYMYTEVLLIEGQYKPKILGDILRGKHDGTGLYHPDIHNEKLSKRLIDDRDTFIEDSRTVSQDILKYGTDLPVSELSKTDYTDTPIVLQQIREREQLEQKRKRELERAKNKPKNVQKPKSEGKRKGNVTIERRGMNVNPISKVKSEGDGFTGRGNDLKSLPNLRRLQRGFESLQGESTVTTQKIATDRGVISFMGERKSGVSGLVANMADTYAVAGKRVLVIDLDIHQRSQTLYFGNYNKAVDEHLGLGNGLMKVALKGSLERVAVQITSRISVLGISREEEVGEEWEETIQKELENIVEEAREYYDIVLIDVPMESFSTYLEGLVSTVDKNILVVENNWYDIENFIYFKMGRYLGIAEELLVTLFKKTSVVLNKYKKGRYDDKGEEVNMVTVNKQLLKKGYPYDILSVVGEIPYYNNWEIQYHTNTRYIWEDRLAEGVYRYIIDKVVW